MFLRQWGGWLFREQLPLRSLETTNGKTNYKMIKCIFFIMKLHYIKLKENDIPDFFSVTFISFLIYSLFFSLVVIYIEITDSDLPSKTYFLGSLVLILLVTSLVILKLKKWHKLDATQ